MSILLQRYSQRMKRRPTPAEKRFRRILERCCKTLGTKYQTQVVFSDGKYIADFYIPSYRIVFEIDGGYHGSPEQIEKDRLRDLWFSEKQIKVVHVSNDKTEDENYCRS